MLDIQGDGLLIKFKGCTVISVLEQRHHTVQRHLIGLSEQIEMTPFEDPHTVD